MLTIFRTNQPLANILLLFYLVIVRASTFIHPLNIAPKAQGVITQWLFSEVSPVDMSGRILAFILVFMQAVLINITIARFRVATEVSLLPGLFYCLVTSLLPDFMILSPILLANTFLILATFNLYDIYKNNTVASRVFDVGFWIGLASLFYFSYILFILWGIVGLGILRGVRPKELLMFLIGIFVPFFLMAVFLYWNDSLPLFSKFFSENSGFLNFVKTTSTNSYVKLSLVLGLAALMVIVSGQLFARRNIAIQKYISIIYWMLLVGGATVFIQRGMDINHLLIISIPLGVLLSMMFQKIGIATAEVLHMVLLGIALIFQFQYLLG